jgi:hypothetical protein
MFLPGIEPISPPIKQPVAILDVAAHVPARNRTHLTAHQAIRRSSALQTELCPFSRWNLLCDPPAQKGLDKGEFKGSESRTPGLPTQALMLNGSVRYESYPGNRMQFHLLSFVWIANKTLFLWISCHPGRLNSEKRRECCGHVRSITSHLRGMQKLASHSSESSLLLCLRNNPHFTENSSWLP